MAPPAARRADPRGPATLDYRIGTFSTLLGDLLERLRTQSLRAGEHAGSRPLAGLSFAARGDWLLGLLEAWAEVGDVLGFYQERIANEGFLATAREERSLRELVRLIDYQPFPGVASGTHLAFRVYTLTDTPEIVIVPRGASVSSIPPRKEIPQEWETVEEIEARAGWNALLPAAPSRVLPRTLETPASGLRLEGAETGLEPGSPILVVTSSAGRESAAFRTVAAVEASEESPTEPASTLVSWERELATPAGGEGVEGPLEAVAVLPLEHSIPLFGHDAPPWEKLADEEKLQFEPMLGGVAVGGGTDAGWRSIGRGLPESGVTALLAGPDGSLYAGSEDGIFRSVDGESWSRSGRALFGQRIEVLAADRRGRLFAGTATNGVLRSPDGEDWGILLGESAREPLVSLGRRSRPRSGRLPTAAVRALAPAGDRLYAGTDHGVFVFVDRRDTWEAVNAGLPGYAEKTGRAGLVVTALVAGRKAGELFAGTDKGVFYTANGGRRWTARNRGLPGFDPESGEAATAVLTLMVHRGARKGDELFFAGTDQGIFRSADGGGTWEALSAGLPGTDPDTGLSTTEVRHLVAATDATTLETRLYAGTPEGLWTSEDLGVYWAAGGDALAERPVTALALSAAGEAIAAMPRGGFASERWPGFYLRHGEIDLAAGEPSVVRGSWLALLQESEEGEPRLAVFRAAAVGPVERQDFTLGGTVTRIVPDRAVPELEAFDLRSARLLAAGRTLSPLAGRVPIVEPLDPSLVAIAPPPGTPPFPRPRAIVVSGRPVRVRFAAGSGRRLVGEDGREIEVGAGEELQVVELSAASGGRYALRLRVEGGGVGAIEAAPGEVEWRPAKDEDRDVAERTTAVWIEPGSTAASAEGPALELSPPLRGAFDPRTVRIHANIAEATQGRTVFEDVLGGGDSTLPNQRFQLTAPPLTYLKTPTAKGYRSTLEIRVNGVLWHEVDSLYDAGPGSRVYVVRHDAAGEATAIFGDGVHGARLPSGRENVVATYRTGMWARGIEAGGLRLLETKPIGLEGVVNPLPVAAGGAPETPGETRRRAPLSLRTLERIVSLSDYEDFCRTYPGIDRAVAAALSTDRGRLVHVTLAAADGRPIAAGDDFHAELLAAIEAARPEPAPTSIASCRRVTLDLAAEVRHDPDRRPGDVERRVSELLAERLSYDRARFGERLLASEIGERIRAVEGVREVRLELFHRSDAAPGLEPYLEARPARWDPSSRRVVAAELLELRSPGGLGLRMVTGR